MVLSLFINTAFWQLTFGQKYVSPSTNEKTFFFNYTQSKVGCFIYERVKGFDNFIYKREIDVMT